MKISEIHGFKEAAPPKLNVCSVRPTVKDEIIESSREGWNACVDHLSKVEVMVDMDKLASMFEPKKSEVFHTLLNLANRLTSNDQEQEARIELSQAIAASLPEILKLERKMK